MKNRKQFSWICSQGEQTIRYQIKGGFGEKSDWSHLNHLAQKVDTKIQWEFPEQPELMQPEMHKSSSLFIQLQLSSQKQLQKKCWKVNSLQIPTNRNYCRSKDGCTP